MPLLNKHNVEVVIIDDSKAKKCDAGCGLDWSSAEVFDLADQQIKARFGAGVRLEYFDLSKPVVRHRALELQPRIRNGGLGLPVLFLNGEPRISGQFDIRMLLDAVEAELELIP